MPTLPRWTPPRERPNTTPRRIARSPSLTNRADGGRPTRCNAWALRLPMILLIDNYDSFTYNLVQRLGELDPNLAMEVVRNDQITPDRVAELKPSHVIISPGP